MIWSLFSFGLHDTRANYPSKIRRENGGIKLIESAIHATIAGNYRKFSMIECILISGLVTLIAPKDILLIPPEKIMHIEINTSEIVVDGIRIQGVDGKQIKEALRECKTLEEG